MSCTAATVYPRIHGERAYPSRPGLRANGLSPHSRGTGGTDFRRNYPHAVYPRIHGERCGKSVNSGLRYGLSPHSRGTGGDLTKADISNRFIPAFTGNGPFFGNIEQGSAVYPRIHGERYFLARAGNCLTGLSPHSRGTVEERRKADAN